MKIRNLVALLVLWTVAIGFAQEKPYPGLFRSTPEEEGVSSEGLLEFIEAVEKEPKITLHSFMLLRHGKIVAEGSWSPYNCVNKHTLYSVTKSFTATAVGLCIAEGAFSLDEKVITFFPDDVPETISPNLAEMTVRHLLMMAPGYSSEPNLTGEGNWVKAILAHPVTHKPGTTLFYNNTGPFLLSAIVQKVTGQKLEDYLTPRLFLPMGITETDWEYNPQKINIGGWGLRVSVESMAKLGQLYLQKGMWNGRQLLPAEWVAQATAIQNKHLPQWLKPGADTSADDYAQGYGFLFWHNRHNSYRASGALGQFIIVMPEHDAVLAVTAGSTLPQKELDLIWEYLLPAFKTNPLPQNEEALNRLETKLSGLELPLPERKTGSKMAKLVTGVAYAIEPNDKGIEEVVFLISHDRCKFLMKTNTERHEMNFGNNEWLWSDTARPGPYAVSWPTLNWPSLYKVAGVYRWKYADTMEMVLHYIEGTHPQTYICEFEKDLVTIKVNDPLNGSNSYVLKGKMRL